jgi:hypothetical protein
MPGFALEAGKEDRAGNQRREGADGTGGGCRSSFVATRSLHRFLVSDLFLALTHKCSPSLGQPASARRMLEQATGAASQSLMATSAKVRPQSQLLSLPHSHPILPPASCFRSAH